MGKNFPLKKDDHVIYGGGYQADEIEIDDENIFCRFQGYPGNSC